MEDVLRRVREARREAGLSQEELARRLGLSQEGYSSLERGRTVLDVRQLLMLAKELKRPVSYFVGDCVQVDGLDSITAEIAGIVAVLPERERLAVLAYARFVAQQCKACQE